MDNKAIASAITIIEQQLETLKQAAGLSMVTGEEEGYEEKEPPAFKKVGRGRRAKSVPSLEAEMDEDKE